jgi:4-amino-4-deoxy-L-arabinose transferase-like glycosyltransferase
MSPVATMVLVAAAMLAARLIAGAFAPLTEDEAYYRLWSMSPAFGYFDHPPMIAWWIWAGRALAGDTSLGVRLLPILGSAAMTWATFDAARQIGLSERAAARAGIWLTATLLMGVGGELAVPDVPAALFWTLTLAFAFRAMNGRRAWWLAAGLAAGLGCLSKYSSLFLAPGLLLLLATSVSGRVQLRSPWPWLAALVAAAVFAPNVIWNADHGWMTFAKQFGRARVEGLDPSWLPKLLGDQFVLLNPLIAIFFALAVRRRAGWPVLVVGFPFAAYLILHSLHGEVQGQWPAPLYPSLAIAAAAAAEAAQGWLARLRTATAVFGLAFAAFNLAYDAAPLDGLLPIRDPASPLRGWPAFTGAVEQTRTKAGAAWVGATTYGVAAQLAADHRIHAPSIEIYDRKRFTFETVTERADFTRPGLIVEPERFKDEDSLRACFARVEPWGRIVRSLGVSATPYLAYRVSEPKRDIERAGCQRTRGLAQRQGAPPPPDM